MGLPILQWQLVMFNRRMHPCGVAGQWPCPHIVGTNPSTQMNHLKIDPPNGSISSAFAHPIRMACTADNPTFPGLTLGQH